MTTLTVTGFAQQAGWARFWSQHKIALLLAPALLALLAIYAAPVATLLLSSVKTPDWSLNNYRQLLVDPNQWLVLLHTLVLAAEVTLLCAAVGYPIAYWMLTLPERGMQIVALLLVFPMWTSVLVRAYSWVTLLGRQGLINNGLTHAGLIDHPIRFLYTEFSVVLGLFQIMLPYFVLTLFGVLKRIDRRLIGAAQSLGANPAVAFLAVLFPLSLPGVISGAVLTFMLSIGAFITPAILGGTRQMTYVMVIEQWVNTALQWGIAAAMAVILLVTVLAIMLIATRLFGAKLGGGASGPARESAIVRFLLGLITPIIAWLRRNAPPAAERPGSVRRHPFRWLLPTIACLAGAITVVPTLIIIPVSFNGSMYLAFPPEIYSVKWYLNYFSRPDWIAPTLISLEVAAATTLLATVSGTMAAIAIARGRFPGRGFLLGLFLAPMITPTLIIAVGIYFQFAAWGIVGTRFGLVLGHLTVTVPPVIVIVLGALRRVDEAPERAARSLGANPVVAFLRVTLPTIRPSVVVAALFAFIASFDDLVIALFISGTSVKTLPRRMWEGLLYEIDPTIAAVSTILIVLSALLLLAGQLAGRYGSKSGVFGMYVGDDAKQEAEQ